MLIDVVDSLYLMMMVADVTPTFNNMIAMNMLLNMSFLIFFKYFFLSFTSTSTKTIPKKLKLIERNFTGVTIITKINPDDV